MRSALLAMSYLRLNEQGLATRALAEAQAIMAEMPAAGQPLEPTWNDWLRAQVLLREAEELLSEETKKGR